MHGHSHEFRTAESRRVTLVGAAVNLFLAVLKTVIGFVGHSQSLIADGIHSISDLASDMLVWFAVKHAGEEPDEEHPYGHGRFETAATLVLGILLIGVAGVRHCVDCRPSLFVDLVERNGGRQPDPLLIALQVLNQHRHRNIVSTDVAQGVSGRDTDVGAGVAQQAYQ